MQGRVIWQEGTSIEGKLVLLFLLNDGCSWVQPTVGGASPELVVLGSLRKQVGQAMRGNPRSSTPPQPRISFRLQTLVPANLLAPALLWLVYIP